MLEAGSHDEVAFDVGWNIDAKLRRQRGESIGKQQQRL